MSWARVLGWVARSWARVMAGWRGVGRGCWLRGKLMATLKKKNFGIDGKLVVNYACSMAWG
ncbi:Ubiquitin-like protein ATG12A [Bienertia sinuspersici]